MRRRHDRGQRRHEDLEARGRRRPKSSVRERRFRFRLAALLGRTVAELEDTLSHSEWVEWNAFLSLYDLPDCFNTTERLGQLIAQSLGGKTKPGDFASYFKTAAAGVSNAYRMLKQYARKPAKKHG